MAIVSSCIVSIPLSLSSLCGTPIISMLVQLMVSHKFLRLCSFSFLLFYFCSSDYIISMDLFSSLLIFNSAYLNLLLGPPGDIFFFYFRDSTFQPPNFYCVFKNNFCLFIYNLYLVRHHSQTFSISLNIFKTSYLKPLSSKSNVRASLCTDSIDCLFFSFMCMSCLSLYAS